MQRKNTRRLSFEGLEERSLLSLTPIEDLTSIVQNTQTDRIGQSLRLLADSTSNDLPLQQPIAADNAKFMPVSFQLNDNRVAIQAVVDSDSSIATLTADLQALGFQAATSHELMVTGWLPLPSISGLSSLASLHYARPLFAAATSIGNTLTGGHDAQRTDVIGEFASLTGDNVQIAVISNSYNRTNGPITAATDIASGDLPGIGNPLGHTTPVTVFRDNVVPTTSVDEGRAMLQIIHDIAPDAELLFSNVADPAGIETQEDFADNIEQLVALGADVIVDDIFFFAEPFFADGPIAQAVDAAVSQGTVYVSAAGNSAANSYEAGFLSSGVTQNFTFGGTNYTELLHDFGGGDIWQTVQIAAGETFVLQWDDPFATHHPGSGGATRNFDFIIRHPITQDVLFVSDDSVIGGDPLESITYTGTTATFEIAIGLRNGVNPGGLLKYVLYGGNSQIVEHATNSSTLIPHANAASAIGVGAAFYQETPELGVDPPVLEDFSSLGDVEILFDASGNRLIQPAVRDGVDLVAPNGVNTTFFGRPDPIGTGIYEADGFPNFFGTSAAAPHVAGLAALLLQANPSLAPAGIELALKESAIDMDNPFTGGFDTGFDAATGYGFIDALGALGRVIDTPQLVGLDPGEYILVNDTRDLLDATANPNDSIIDIDLSPGSPGNQVSLRAAIVAANAGGTNARTLLVPEGNYAVTLPGTGSTTQGDLDITGVVTVIGAGAGMSIINATGLNDRIFDVSTTGASLNAARLTLTGGDVVEALPGSNGGGAILAKAGTTVDLNRVALVDNTSNTFGGAIRVADALTTLRVRNSVVTGNTASGSGGLSRFIRLARLPRELPLEAPSSPRTHTSEAPTTICIATRF